MGSAGFAPKRPVTILADTIRLVRNQPDSLFPVGERDGFYAAAGNARLVTVSGRSTVQRATGFPVAGSTVHLSKHLARALPAARVLVSVV
jgi:hypothetical protein